MKETSTKWTYLRRSIGFCLTLMKIWTKIKDFISFFLFIALEMNVAGPNSTCITLFETIHAAATLNKNLYKK